MEPTKIKAWLAHPRNRDIVLAVSLVLAAVLVWSIFYAPSHGRDQTETTATPAPASAGTDQEAQLAQILGQIEGVGAAEVMISTPAASMGNDAEIAGVVVVAEGAQDLAVRLDILQAVRTALDVMADQVDIFPMQSVQGES